MAGNAVNHPWGVCYVSLANVITSRVDSTSTHMTIKFDALGWVSNSLNWAGFWWLSTNYKNNLTGVVSQPAKWNPSRIDTSGIGVHHHVGTVSSGNLVYPRQANDYTVYIYAAFETPWGYSEEGQTITIPALPTPSAPTSCSHTRDTDNKNTVKWTNTGSNPRTNNLIERSVNGGGYTQIASISGDATSYVDSTTQPDSFYAYRVRALYVGNSINRYSGYSNTSTATYNSPLVTTNLSASRNTDNTVKVSFVNSSLNATGLEYQRSSNASSWSSSVVVAGKVTSFNDNPGGGTWYYRVRNTRGSLVSAWSANSNAVVTIIAPSAPTLTSPSNGAVINNAVTPTRLSWKHNPIDGSAQTAAEIRHSINGGSSWSSSVQVSGSAAYKDLATTTWGVNSQVLWQVRTKGAHADFGPWSASGSFVVRQVPQVVITSPASDEVIKVMPLSVAWSYSDQSGTQLSALLRILNKNGEQVWRKEVTGTSYILSASEFLPNNGSAYTLQLDVVSTSSLTAQTTGRFTTDYIEPATPMGHAVVDISSASVSLFVMAGEDEAGKPSTDSLSILRRHADGRQVVVASYVPSGTSLNDPYCPTEQDITYLFVAHAVSGAVSSFEVSARIPGKMCYWINYGQNVCALLLNSESNRETQHDAELFQTAGDGYPLAFYGDAKHSSGSFSGVALRRNEELVGQRWPVETADFDGLAAYTGAVVIRIPGWDAFVADIQVSQSENTSSYESVSVSWRRVRNHDLAI